MTDQIVNNEESALMREVFNDFIQELAKDENVPTRIVEALKRHFSGKASISAQELKSIIATPMDSL